MNEDQDEVLVNEIKRLKGELVMKQNREYDRSIIRRRVHAVATYVLVPLALSSAFAGSLACVGVSSVELVMAFWIALPLTGVIWRLILI